MRFLRDNRCPRREVISGHKITQRRPVSGRLVLKGMRRSVSGHVMASGFCRKPPGPEIMAISVKTFRKLYGHRCFYCGEWLRTRFDNSQKARSWDHVVPKSKGGINSKQNLVPCCVSCNQEKAALTIEEFRRTRSRKTFFFEKATIPPKIGALANGTEKGFQESRRGGEEGR